MNCMLGDVEGGNSMSDSQDMSAYKAENINEESQAVYSAQDQTTIKSIHSLQEIGESLDGPSYFLGEVPQQFMVDPQAYLPLNSDRLVGSSNMLEKLMGDVNALIQEEVTQIQKTQKKITLWEDKIEKNKVLIQKNLVQIKQNTTEIVYDKKNRDYWWGRAETVSLDYEHAEAASRLGDWNWIIKKWGLKNADGTILDAGNASIEELCNGAASNLAGKYRSTGNKYDHAQKDKAAATNRLIRENSSLLTSNDTLQNYISASYVEEIEPYQDGVLLLKEFSVKLKVFGQEEHKVTYGELRSWAEPFLNDFLKSNPRIRLAIVTEFRKLASIPLPAEHC
jgi:hypothetical protein